jgi:hypothetical protein
MGLKKTLRKIGRALPVVAANAPAIAEVVRQVQEALKKPKPVQPAADAPAPAVPAE